MKSLIFSLLVVSVAVHAADLTTKSGKPYTEVHIDGPRSAGLAVSHIDNPGEKESSSSQPKVEDVKIDFWASLNQNVAKITLNISGNVYCIELLQKDLKSGNIIRQQNHVYDYPVWGIVTAFVAEDNSKKNFVISYRHYTKAKIEIIAFDPDKKYLEFKFECRLVGGEKLDQYHQYASPVIKISGANFEKLK